MTATVTLEVEVPCDLEAEYQLAGCAVEAFEAAELVLSRLSIEDFYDRSVRWVLLATRDAPRCPVDGRVAWIAQRAGVEPGLLREWVAHRVVYADTGGGLARRVAAAAERRLEVHELSTRLRELTG